LLININYYSIVYTLLLDKNRTRSVTAANKFNAILF